MIYVSGNTQKSERKAAILLLIATAVLWSLGGMMIKLVDWNPLAIAGMRSAIALLLMIAVYRKFPVRWSLPQLGGAVAYTVTVILFVSANKLTTASNAILLQYASPVYVALLGSWLLKEKVTKRDWITIAFVLSGMFLFFFDGLSPRGLLGSILAILSGVSFAFLIVFMRMQKDGSPVESAMLGNLFTAIAGIPFMFSSMPSGKSWLGLILLGVFQLGLSYILYSIAIKNVTALEGILIPVIEPLLNPIWVMIAIGEVPGRWSLAGGAVVLSAVLIRCILPLKALKKEKAPAGS